MRIANLLAAILLLTLPLTAQDRADRWTPEDIIHTEYLGNPAFSPDNRMLVWTKRRGVKEKDKFVNDLYLTRLDLVKDGLPRTVQLTRLDESDHSPLFSRDGEKIYFLSSRDKGKKLWALSIYGGEAEEVAEFKNGISDLRWLNDTVLVFTGHDGPTRYETELEKEKDNTVIVEDSVYWKRDRLYSYNLKDKTTRRLTDNAYPLSGYAVSHDGRYLVYTLTMSPHYGVDANPKPKHYLLDLRSGQKREILQGLQTPGNPQFAGDDSGFYFTAVTSSNPEWNGAGISEVYFYDLGAHNFRKVDLQWDWAMEGDYQVVGNDVLVALANGTTTKLAFYRKNGNGWTKSDLDLSVKNEHVDMQSVSDDYRRVVYSHSTAGQLPRYYAADLTRQGDRLTFTNEQELVKLNTKLGKKPVARHEVMRWKGYNGDEVDGLLYYPENYQPGRRYPLVLSIHGGPAGSDMDRWSERWSTYPQLLSQRGAFVLKPNYHGSSHHGQAFVESIKKNYYTPELEDITKAISELDGRGMIDMDSLGVMGWSNGAILATMLTVRYPDMFKVACPGAGDVNWTSDFGTCEFGVSFDQSYFGGAPYDDVDGKPYNEAYITYSPLFELEKVKTPTIIFHGSEDRAVPRDQGWEYYRALQQAGQTAVRFVWFPDQPHGLQKITHQLRKMNEELAWIDQHLFGKAPEVNPAFKEDSPLALLLKSQGSARHDGRYGTWSGGRLLPEVVKVKADSISVGRYEVTNAQFAQFDAKHTFPASEANYPARVPFARAQAYVQWLSKQTGKSYRLPSAAEAAAWHKLAHEKGAGENTLNHWAGYDLTPADHAALAPKLKEAKLSLVRETGTFAPLKVEEAELFDLAGNVAEYDTTGKTYGYSAYDYVDPNDTTVQPAAGNVGFRVVLQ